MVISRSYYRYYTTECHCCKQPEHRSNAFMPDYDALSFHGACQRGFRAVCLLFTSSFMIVTLKVLKYGLKYGNGSINCTVELYEAIKEVCRFERAKTRMQMLGRLSLGSNTRQQSRHPSNSYLLYLHAYGSASGKVLVNRYASTRHLKLPSLETLGGKQGYVFNEPQRNSDMFVLSFLSSSAASWNLVLSNMVPPASSKKGESTFQSSFRVLFVAPPTKWEMVERAMSHDCDTLGPFESLRPCVALSLPHRQLSCVLFEHCKEIIQTDHIGLLFLEKDALTECKVFGTSPRRGDGRLAAEEMKFMIFDIYGVRLYAVFTRMEKIYSVLPYYQHTGAGISNLLARFLYHKISGCWPIDSMSVDQSASFVPGPTYVLTSPYHHQFQLWIVKLLEHMPAPHAPETSLSPIGPSTGERLPATLEPDDIYLFPNRSAALYRLHQYLNKANGNEFKSVAFGPVFQSTIHILREWGAGCLEIAHGDDGDMQQLQEICEAEISADRKVQAVYVEFPCHPNFECGDLYTLRCLADVYHFILVVDVSARGLCNIDLMSVADVVVVAPFDVVCGIIVLNPLNRPTYRRLRKLFAEKHKNEVFHLDAEALVQSASNYRTRQRTINHNADVVATFLQKQISNPLSTVSKVGYPRFNKTSRYYEMFMRGACPGFTPGYGGLISVEFEELEYAKAFFNAVELYPSSNLRESVTCIYPYNRAFYDRSTEDESKAEGHGWSMAQVRISIGSEDDEDPLATVQRGLRVADAVKQAKNASLVVPTA